MDRCAPIAWHSYLLARPTFLNGVPLGCFRRKSIGKFGMVCLVALNATLNYNKHEDEDEDDCEPDNQQVTGKKH